VAVQPDGKIVVVGEAHRGPTGDFAVLRYHADGTLDEEFGRGGIVTTDIARTANGAFAVVLQPDGKIVAGGDVGRGRNGDFAFVRYNPDGTLDQSFGVDGVMALGLSGGGDDQIRALALDPSGRIVAAGSIVVPPVSAEEPVRDFALMRLLSNGGPDQLFGLGGQLHTDFGNTADEAYALALQPDGKIVAAGVSDNDGRLRPALARYDSAGSLDPTFGDGGLVSTEVDGQGDARALALQPDGKLVVAGRLAQGEAGWHPLTIRYQPGGLVDGSFGPGGVVIADGPVQGRASGVAVQPDGGIVIGADAEVDGQRDALAGRYRPDGLPDPRFGTAGFAFSGPTGFAEDSTGLALQPDGQIVVVGAAVFGDRSAGDADVTVLRFLGGDTGPVGPPADLAVEMVAAPDGGVARVGSPLRYLVTVANSGPATAEAVVVTDELPATVTLLSTTGGQGEACQLEGTLLTCPLGVIAPGATVGLTITVEPTVVGPLTNTVRVASDQFDPDQSDDTATVTLTVQPRSSIRVNPGVVPLGRVVMVIGAGFVPDVPVSLGYQGMPGLREVTPGADGSFVAPVVVFVETTPGSRAVEARSTTVPGEVLATTNLLIVTDSLAPPNFVGRR
jgi:uncharacterized delta-60 repeat protein/uncharacterized repeat protein (TIGR01451 family)